MPKETVFPVEKYNRKNKLNRIRQRIVHALACMVVFVTTYALILPAITMEKSCNLEEHTHTDACYAKAETQTVLQLSCTYDTLGVHVHTRDCLDAQNVPQCGYADYLVHIHCSDCCDETGLLVCRLPEVKAHNHTQECYPAAEVHTHGEGCYAVQQGELLCQLHAHSADCYAKGGLVCGQEEAEGHTHGEGCSETVLTCPLTTEPHVHTEGCYQQLTCDLPEDETHTHSEECSGTVLACDLTEQAHSHGEGCYQTNLLCTLAEQAAHVHTDACYDRALTCGQETEHLHSDTCYAQETVLTCTLAETEATGTETAPTCGKTVIQLHTHSEDCYETGTDDPGNVQKTLICTQPEVLEHIHSADCFTAVEVPLENGGELTCTLAETEGHTHTDRCYGTWELICTLQEHTHDETCTLSGLSEDDRAWVLFVKDLIEEMPSADEIDAKVAEFQKQGDEDGEIAYLEEVYLQVQRTYWEYDAMGDALQAYVINADKLLELEYIWSISPYAGDTGSTIYHINTYATGSTTQQTSGTVLYTDGTPVGNFGFSWWKEVVVEWQDGYMRVQRVLPADGRSKTGHTASSTGFILLFHDGVSEGYPYNVRVGDYVTLDFFLHQTGDDTYAYNANGYGNVSFSRTAPNNSIVSDQTHVLQYQENGGKVAHTSAFIDLNLYNYNYNVNDTWRENKYYPGFQWPGGAYTNDDNGADTTSAWNIGIPNYSVDRHYVDSVNFGDSIVANHQYANSKTEYDENDNGKYGKAVNATGVGKVYTTTAAQSVGKINWLWYSGSYTDDSMTNRPAGYSTTGKAIQFKMSDNTPITVDNISLKYLFPYDQTAGTTNANGVTKVNSRSIDGLFQINPISGLYYFNSRDNHAQYSNNKFTLYEEMITPNFILYPFGNFLPFNNINTQATQVGAFNTSGGMKTYVDQTVFDLQKWMAEGSNSAGNPADPFSSVYGYSSRYQLGIMLNEYAEDWNTDDGWDTLSSGGALADFFAGTDKPDNSAPTFSQAMLDKIYNIDWDQATDFFFGMDMSMEFLMPKDGLTGHDNGNNTTGSWTILEDGTFMRTGEKDGIPDYPMAFNFSGDDDVWVYIDGILFLDLTGIHRHVGGTIDFQAGVVYYFPLETATGDTSNNTTNATYYYYETFEDIIKRSYSSSETTQMNAALAQLRPVLNADGSQRYLTGTNVALKTFKDYTTHTFKFFYMERGSGSSVCRMNFNFPLLQKNTIAVSKKTAASDPNVKPLGNPDYYFNIVTPNNELFVGPNSVSGVSTYKIKIGNDFLKDSSGNPIEYSMDDELGQYGIFKLKAGQTAVFEIPENKSGTYFVQELIKAEDNVQYSKVEINLVHDTTISDTAYKEGTVLETRYNNLIQWNYRSYFWNSETMTDTLIGPGGYKWYGRSGYDTNGTSNAAFYFEQSNTVDVTKLSSLSIRKQVVELDEEQTQKDFTFVVKLDGALLPTGTPYKVGDETGTVADGGKITLAHDETALIENIFLGTEFEVTEEVHPSYNASFAVTGADDAETLENGVKGKISYTEAQTAITVTNTEIGSWVEIPVTKRMSVPGTSGRTYTFQLQEVNSKTDLTAKTGGFADTRTLTFTTEGEKTTGDNPFRINYLPSLFAGDEAQKIFYYTITEAPYTASADDVLTDSRVYLAEVTVTKDTTGPKAEITGFWTVGAEGALTALEAPQAEFTNTLIRNLILQKTVEGSQVAQQREFRFNLELTAGESNAAVPTELSAVLTRADGTTQAQSYPLTEGKCTITLKHGESLKLMGIPYKAQWKVTETDAEGFAVVHTGGTGPTAEGTAEEKDTTVSFTNKQLYELPHTGGSGTAQYTMGGLLLAAAALFTLMYNKLQKRRGYDRS